MDINNLNAATQPYPSTRRQGAHEPPRFVTRVRLEPVPEADLLRRRFNRVRELSLPNGGGIRRGTISSRDPAEIKRMCVDLEARYQKLNEHIKNKEHGFALVVAQSITQKAWGPLTIYHAHAQRAMGYIAYLHKQNKRALYYLKKANGVYVKLDPSAKGLGFAHYIAGKIYSQRKDYMRAQKCFDFAKEIYSHYPDSAKRIDEINDSIIKLSKTKWPLSFDITPLIDGALKK